MQNVQKSNFKSCAIYFQSEGEERIREAVVATFKSYRMCGNNANASINITQQYLTCDIATEKLDLAAEHIKTQNGESADVSKVLDFLSTYAPYSGMPKTGPLKSGKRPVWISALRIDSLGKNIYQSRLVRILAFFYNHKPDRIRMTV